MGVYSICLSLVVLVFLDTSLAHPLIEGGIAGRTFSQLNMKCGTTSAFKRITMASPTGGATQNCEYTVRAFSTRVCQVRIDLSYVDLDRPRLTPTRPYAFCADGHLTIDGLEFDLCGLLRGQHVYVPFDVRRLADVMKINFQVGSGFAAWSIEVNQIECSHRAALVTHDEKEAPNGCLQYFYQTSGRVESFNFGHHIGGTNYAICFNRGYNQNAVLELSDIQFEMDSVGTGATAGFDDDCLTNLSTEPKDYIAIPFAVANGEEPHSLFCGDSLHGKELIFSGAGPMVIHVNTDRLTSATYDEIGFSFWYRIRV